MINIPCKKVILTFPLSCLTNVSQSEVFVCNCIAAELKNLSLFADFLTPNCIYHG